MVRLGDRAHIRAERHFEYVPEPEFQKRGFDPPGRRLFSELSHVRRCDLHHNFVAPFQSAYQLKDLRFVRDRTERTTDHAHAAGHAFVVVDLCAAQIVALDGFHAARFRARARVVGDGVVRADGLAPPALDTLGLIDERSAVYDRNGALGAHFRTGMRHAAAAVIRDLVKVGRARRARGGNDLHQRRFVILVRDVAFPQSARDMHGYVLGAQRQPHRKAHAFRTDGALAPDAFAVDRSVARGDLIGNGLASFTSFSDSKATRATSTNTCLLSFFKGVNNPLSMIAPFYRAERALSNTLARPARKIHEFFRAARIKPAKSGCGALGRDLNSGWNCTPT